MKNLTRSGFTLIELVVVFAVIAVLAAMLSPVVTKYIEEARITRASQDAQQIADAILNFNKNTGKWPIYKSGVLLTTTFLTLQGPGSDPSCSSCGSTWLPSDSADRGDLGGILELNSLTYTTVGKFAWRGPYMTGVGSDPWGNRYIVNAQSLSPALSRAGFVLSAGPDGIIETTFSQTIATGGSGVTVSGDDIIARIR